MKNGGTVRELFEVARAYRAVYPLRSAYDRTPVMSVPAAIASAELTLRMEHRRVPGAATAAGEVRPIS
jgi:hypothetical protein